MNWSRFANPLAIDRRGWGGQVGDAGYAGKIHLERIKIRRDGYDVNGRYYGVGAPVFDVMSDNGTIHTQVRAGDRDAAKAVVREMYPSARFH